MVADFHLSGYATNEMRVIGTAFCDFLLGKPTPARSTQTVSLHSLTNKATPLIDGLMFVPSWNKARGQESFIGVFVTSEIIPEHVAPVSGLRAFGAGHLASWSLGSPRAFFLRCVQND